jgi:subfamily B ATP-binding cassette protein HlyB/CyaB
VSDNNNTQQQQLDTGLASLVMMAKFLGKPADINQLKHSSGYGSELVNDTVILRLAKDMGLKAKKITSKWDRLIKLELPAILELNSGEFIIIAKAAQDKVLVHDLRKRQPDVMTQEELEAIWNGKIILITTRSQIAGEERKFDFTWFIPVIYRYRRILTEVLIISFFLQIFALITPLFFQVIMDKVLVHRGLTTLDVLIIGMVTISIFEVIMGGLRTYIFSHTSSRIDVELGSRVFKHMTSLPLKFFSTRKVGQTVARVRELENIRSFLTGSAVTVLLDVLFTVVFFIVMYFYSPKLTVIVLITVPLYIGLSVAITPVLRSRLNEKFQRGAENQAFLVESITGVETLKSLAVEPQAQRKWEEQLAGYVAAGLKANHIGNFGGQGAQLISKMMSAAILWIGSSSVINGDITVGQLIAFNMIAGRTSGPILRLAQMWQDFQQVRISIERLGDVLNSPAEPSTSANSVRLPDVNGHVKFEGITFRYSPQGKEILRNVNLDISAGQVVGVVGPSGSGKSTLTKLVQRMYVPESGRVLVDGVDLAMADPAWLRRQVGVVLQENYLFSRSIRDNIALSDPSLSLDEVIRASKLVGAHEFIMEMQHGYDSVLDERGGNLSGGQRQRVAMARSLVGNPRILILDEATSALDYESERIIQDNMKNICQGRTVFIIAHRLSTVRDADRIITIDRGVVVEDGSHEELIQMNGRYAQLHKAQTH